MAYSTAFEQFQSTLPGWGATQWYGGYHRRQPISIHAPRMGSDSVVNNGGALAMTFQSTLPGWGATIFPDNMRYLGGISIHAPRMGSDLAV